MPALSVAHDAGLPEPSAAPELSAIVLVDKDHAGFQELLAAYEATLAGLGRSCELVFVVNAAAQETLAQVEARSDLGGRSRVVVLRQWPGETAALATGLPIASGATILILPPFAQVDPADIGRVVHEAGSADLVVGARVRGPKPAMRLGSGLFHGLLHALFGSSFDDLTCRVRAGRREVLEEVVAYGAQHHFLPLLASERGFKVRQVPVSPGTLRLTSPILRLGALSQLQFLLDVVALYVVLKFLKRPLRFFGMVGLPVLIFGAIATALLVSARLFFGVPLGDRPALVLSVMMIVLGVQVIALGLIGEIIIFTSSKRIKDYTVEKII